MITKSKYSISAFFPCFNDAGTIASMVELTTSVLKEINNDFEIIVIDDGSTDSSRKILKELAQKNRYLKLVFHKKNRGYGGALISGFTKSHKELVFYTDGDFQYNPEELKNFLHKMTNRIDIVQGYKTKRNDPWYRLFIGDIYNFVVRLAFSIKIRDVDCDFRLIRRSVFNKVTLCYNSGVITVEMVKKFQDAGFKFAQVGVSHYNRAYGSSQFFNFKRIARVIIELSQLWIELVFNKWRIPISSKTKKF
ncbi:MAG: Glycosyl transferase family 2 [Candidatus Curtissbacteria bacterium GW2011_GWA1_41_11]|uniref:Glycosyl transferase family 2 n=1 Tax=Candidatus Curtissbacteria bacterium GW2011_GWA1_41_11 TaxID=1618409 RepID=A0A0G0UKV6_9BACT|nr:MAG: Glycosyl transferase family 2 [Candidatus Curtissbacteria bacterium GW2011_GWA1_41_11]